jgi:hypothetical protein
MEMIADLTRAAISTIYGQFHDHGTFCRESIKIRNLQGSVVPFELYPGPWKLAEAIRRQRLQKKPVRIVVLKTRRSFFTAGVCAEMFHDIPFFPGRKGLIIADRYKPAGFEAFDYLVQFQRTYKSFTREGIRLTLPELVRDSQEKCEWQNGSSVEVFSADTGEVRGAGKHFILCDEVAFWRDPSRTLTGVLNMVPYLPDTTVIIQSTANGIGGEFYEMCQKAQDPANDGGWEFLFFGWLEHPVYSLPLNPGLAAKLKATLTPEEVTLQRVHGATLEQLNWRRKTIAVECRGDVELFNQEYPTTAFDAFLASGRPAFDHKAIQLMPVVNGRAGELKVDEEGPIRRLRFEIGGRGALTIFKAPEPGHTYVIGADPSKGRDVSSDQRGKNPDYSVGFVVDAATGEQVGLLRARIRPVAFAEYLALLGKWYRWAYLVPEANDAGFIDALVQTGYPLEAIYHRQRDPTDRRPPRMEDIGFETTALTRSWLVSAADDAIRGMGITIHSVVVAQECRTFVIKPNGKKEHQEGCHDDCVFALALAAIGMRFAPKARIALTNVLEAQKRRYRFGKVGDKLRRDDDDPEDESDHKRPFKSW